MAAKRTRTEQLRRAIADAHRSAAAAATAAWRARRRMDAIRELVTTPGTYPIRGDSIRAFLDAETKRLLDEAHSAENGACTIRGSLYDLAELLGVRAVE